MELPLRNGAGAAEHQSMKRLLLVPERPDDTPELLQRGRRAAAVLGPDVETVLIVNDPTARRRARVEATGVRLVPVHPFLAPEERLDQGLLLRPLPDQLVVVGTSAAGTAAELSLFSRLLEARSDLAAITAGTLDAASVIELGGVFRPGLVVPAGGFGERSAPLDERLASIGADAVWLSTDSVGLLGVTA